MTSRRFLQKLASSSEEYSLLFQRIHFTEIAYHKGQKLKEILTKFTNEI